MLIQHDGRITFSQLFTLAVIIFVIVNGIKFIRPWRDYYQLKEAMQASVNQVQHLNDQDMIKIVMDKAKVLGIRLAPEDIQFARIGERGARMHAEYEVTLTFPWGFYRKLIFRPEVFASR